jgi:hypothetical protein
MSDTPTPEPEAERTTAEMVADLRLVADRLEALDTEATPDPEADADDGDTLDA